jgi:hypothetical protein
VRQRNVTGYTLVVTPPEGPDGTAPAPFEQPAGEEIDYPDPIAGCAADIPDPAPADPEDPPVDPEDPPADPAADPPAPKTKTKAAAAGKADGGDQK